MNILDTKELSDKQFYELVETIRLETIRRKALLDSKPIIRSSGGTWVAKWKTFNYIQTDIETGFYPLLNKDGLINVDKWTVIGSGEISTPIIKVGPLLKISNKTAAVLAQNDMDYVLWDGKYEPFLADKTLTKIAIVDDLQ